MTSAPPERLPAPPVGPADAPPDRSHAPRIDPVRTGGTAGGTGTYRRRIVVWREDERTVAGGLEDDFHHFRVRLVHDDAGRITRAAGRGVRGPWTTCLEAGELLTELEGLDLGDHAAHLGSLVDPKRHCTHLFDLTGIAAAHATRGTPRRRYDIEITDRAGGTRRRATIWRDELHLITWELDEVDGEANAVSGPAEWVGAPLWTGFIAWATERLDPDTAEAAIALRRAIRISHGRDADLDELASAAEITHVMGPVCHTFQPSVAPVGLRNRGSARDLTHHPEVLLADPDVPR